MFSVSQVERFYDVSHLLHLVPSAHTITRRISHAISQHARARFPRFKSDFFLKGCANSSARQRTCAAIDTFRAFCESETNCKRHDILRHFGETPSFGARCGNCVNCLARSQGIEAKATSNRDLTDEVESILEAVRSFGRKAPSKTHLIPKAVAIYASRRRTRESGVPRKKTFFESLLLTLVSHGYLRREERSSRFGNRQSTWEVFVLGPNALTRRDGKAIVLPAPRSLLEYERAHEEKVKTRLKELEERGVDLSLVPSQELKAGRGPVLSALTQFQSLLSRYRASGRDDMASKSEELVARISRWRDATAIKLAISPSDVIAEHLIRTIVYSNVRTSQDLRAIGVRVRNVEELASLVTRSVSELGLTVERKDDDDSRAIVLPTGTFRATSRPPYDPVASTRKSTKTPSWITSYDMFMRSSSVTVSAVAATAGPKAVQSNTTVNHLLYALVSGRPIDLDRLWATLPPSDVVLTSKTWKEIETIYASFGDEDDLTSQRSWSQGTGVSNFRFAHTMKYMRKVCNGRLCAMLDIDWNDRSTTQRQELNQWRNAINRWALLKRAGVPVGFA